jgi:hypothetical protein
MRNWSDSLALAPLLLRRRRFPLSMIRRCWHEVGLLETHSCLLVVFALRISLDRVVPPRRLRSPLCVNGLCGSGIESCEGSDYRLLRPSSSKLWLWLFLVEGAQFDSILGRLNKTQPQQPNKKNNNSSTIDSCARAGAGDL